MKSLYARIGDIEQEEAMIGRARVFKGTYYAIISVDDGGNQEEAACTHDEFLRFLDVVGKRLQRRKRMLKKIIALRYLKRA